MPLGLILKNESNSDDMISILSTLQHRIPACSSDVEPQKTRHTETLVGGDQFSTAMARRVIAERKNSTNDTEKLQGLIPVCKDWHTKLCFATVKNN